MGLRDRVLQGIEDQVIVDSDKVLRFDNWLCVAKMGDLIQLIL